MTLHDEPVDRDFIFRRVREAVEYRRAFADLHSCRLIFAESDRLPALIVDSFGDVLVMQCLALGMERYKQDVTDALVELLHPAGIYERSDVPVRALEGLEQYTGLRYGQVPDRVEMVENGVHFWVDVKQGQKTGFFLDQKENRAAIAPFVRDARVLDCFTHTGSFALHAGHYGAGRLPGWIFPSMPASSPRKTPGSMAWRTGAISRKPTPLTYWPSRAAMVKSTT